jgi:ubiquinone/menaquinone biosynthesis C-methylase UbiE
MHRARFSVSTEGWHGWDDYAPFYDWENARTVQRRDVAFWRRLARRCGGRTLELGCGTGRIALPVARSGVPVIGIDRSEPMLAVARRRAGRSRARASLRLVRGDIRSLPFRSDRAFDLVMAPYGILQSLLRDADLASALRSVARVTARGGIFAADLVPDLPRWAEYRRRVSLRGRRRAGESQVTLIESVRQNRRRGLTIFDQEFVERSGRRRETRRFSLTFRTLSVPTMVRRFERAGFEVTAVLGDYDGGPWDTRSDVWVIVAARR